MHTAVSARAPTLRAPGRQLRQFDDSGAEGRALNEQEISAARAVYGNTIDYAKVQLRRSSTQYSHTRRQQIFLRPDLFERSSSTLTQAGLIVLIHELMHVRQLQQGQGLAIARQEIAQVFRRSGREQLYNWYTPAVSGVTWGTWSYEAQAEAMEAYFRAQHFGLDSQLPAGIVGPECEGARRVTRNHQNFDVVPACWVLDLLEPYAALVRAD